MPAAPDLTRMCPARAPTDSGPAHPAKETARWQERKDAAAAWLRRRPEAHAPVSDEGDRSMATAEDAAAGRAATAAEAFAPVSVGGAGSVARAEGRRCRAAATAARSGPVRGLAVRIHTECCLRVTLAMRLAVRRLSEGFSPDRAPRARASRAGADGDGRGGRRPRRGERTACLVWVLVRGRRKPRREPRRCGARAPGL